MDNKSLLPSTSKEQEVVDEIQKDIERKERMQMVIA